MKKIVVIFCVLLSLCFSFSVNAVASISAVVNNDVEGYIGETIEDQMVTVSLLPSGQCTFENLNYGDDITSWFTNIPDNLYATVESVVDDVITVRFTGDIDDGESEGISNIEVVIPYIEDDVSTPDNEEVYYIKFGANVYEDSITDIDNSNAHYIISDKNVLIEYDGPYTVSGYVGEVLVEQIVVCEFKENSQGEELDLDAIGKTLPVVNGLTPTITDWDDVNMKITITYSGTPIVTSQDLIHTTFPKDYMMLNVVDRVVEDREDVKFNIIDRTPEPELTPEPEPIPTPIPYIIPATGIK